MANAIRLLRGFREPNDSEKLTKTGKIIAAEVAAVALIPCAVKP
jgi:hypothetical protein